MINSETIISFKHEGDYLNVSGDWCFVTDVPLCGNYDFDGEYLTCDQTNIEFKYFYPAADIVKSIAEVCKQYKNRCESLTKELNENNKLLSIQSKYVNSLFEHLNGMNRFGSYEKWYESFQSIQSPKNPDVWNIIDSKMEELGFGSIEYALSLFELYNNPLLK